MTVKSSHRPATGLHLRRDAPAFTLEKLVEEGKAPVYVVHFTQAEAAESAQDFTSINVCTRTKAAIASAIEGFKFNSPYGRSSSAG